MRSIDIKKREETLRNCDLTFTNPEEGRKVLRNVVKHTLMLSNQIKDLQRQIDDLEALKYLQGW